MGDWFRQIVWGLAICGVVFFGCGDGDEEPAGPEVSPEITSLARTLVQSMQQAFLISLVQDPVAIQGMAGTLEIAGNTWTFKGYSPDGRLFIDGTLAVEKDKFPVPAKGELQLSGSSQGTLIVDILISVQGGGIAATGTLQLGDQVWDIAEVLAQQATGGD